MKKLLSLIAGIALTSSAAFGQLTNGSTAPNWTLTDINGNSWTLYTLLAQGKPVFIDVSATWCGPCWNYHNTRALDSLYDFHGPAGTIDQMCYVFFIEGDGATNSADLNGTGSNTQGDWVTGTPFPIIDPAAAVINPWNTSYAIAYFPTIYMICPDQKIYEVGQVNYASLVSAMNTCPFPLDVLPSNANMLACNTTFNPEFTMKNNSMSVALTSCAITYKIDAGSPQVYNWTGNLAAGQSTSVSLPTTTTTVGNHTLMITTANPNAGIDNNNNNNTHTYSFGVVTVAGSAIAYTNSFTTVSFPYSNWELSNPDNDITWTRVSTNSGSLKNDCYNNGNRGSQDAFILEPMDLSTATTPSLKFDLADCQYSAAYVERLEVYVSGDCGVTWTSGYNKSGATLATVAMSTNAFTPTTAGQWRTECVDLTPYIGNNKVFVKFVCTNDYGNNMYIDNINVSNVACATGIIDLNNIDGMNLFPNPVNDQLNIRFSLNETAPVIINIYNMIGELVSTKTLGDMSGGIQNVQMSTLGLDNGLYMVELIAGENRSLNRVTVAH